MSTFMSRDAELNRELSCELSFLSCPYRCGDCSSNREAERLCILYRLPFHVSRCGVYVDTPVHFKTFVFGSHFGCRYFMFVSNRSSEEDFARLSKLREYLGCFEAAVRKYASVFSLKNSKLFMDRREKVVDGEEAGVSNFSLLCLSGDVESNPGPVVPRLFFYFVVYCLVEVLWQDAPRLIFLIFFSYTVAVFWFAVFYFWCRLFKCVVSRSVFLAWRAALFGFLYNWLWPDFVRFVADCFMFVCPYGYDLRGNLENLHCEAFIGYQSDDDNSTCLFTENGSEEDFSNVDTFSMSYAEATVVGGDFVKYVRLVEGKEFHHRNNPLVVPSSVRNFRKCLAEFREQKCLRMLKQVAPVQFCRKREDLRNLSEEEGLVLYKFVQSCSSDLKKMFQPYITEIEGRRKFCRQPEEDEEFQFSYARKGLDPFKILLSLRKTQRNRPDFVVFSFRKGPIGLAICEMEVKFSGYLYSSEVLGFNKSEAKEIAAARILKAIVHDCEFRTHEGFEAHGITDVVEKVQTIFRLITNIPGSVLHEVADGFPAVRKVLKVLAKVVLHIYSLWRDSSIANVAINAAHILIDFGVSGFPAIVADAALGVCAKLQEFFQSFGPEPFENPFEDDPEAGPSCVPEPNFPYTPEEIAKSTEDVFYDSEPVLKKRPGKQRAARSSHPPRPEEFSEQMPAKFHAHGLLDVLPSLIGAIFKFISELFCSVATSGTGEFFVSKFSKIFTKISMRDFATGCSAARNVAGLLDLLFKCFKFVTAWVKAGTTPEELGCAYFQQNRLAISTWNTLVQDFITEHTSEEAAKSPALRAQVHTLYETGKQYAEGCNFARACGNAFSQLRASYTKISEYQAMCIKGKVFAFTRPEPVVIYLYGDPGAGKSVAAIQLARQFATYFGVEPDSGIHSLSSATKHMDGYTGQPIVIIDDIGQMADNEDWTHFCEMVSTTPWIAPKADCKEKGMYFTSPLIIATSNIELPRPKTVLFPGAIQRRLTFKVNVHPGADFSRDGKLDAQAAAAANAITNGQCLDLDLTQAPAGVLLQGTTFDLLRREVSKQLVIRRMIADGFKDTQTDVVGASFDQMYEAVLAEPGLNLNDRFNAAEQTGFQANGLAEWNNSAKAWFTGLDHACPPERSWISHIAHKMSDWRQQTHWEWAGTDVEDPIILTQVHGNHPGSKNSMWFNYVREHDVEVDEAPDAPKVCICPKCRNFREAIGRSNAGSAEMLQDFDEGGPFNQRFLERIANYDPHTKDGKVLYKNFCKYYKSRKNRVEAMEDYQRWCAAGELSGVIKRMVTRHPYAMKMAKLCGYAISFYIYYKISMLIISTVVGIVGSMGGAIAGMFRSSEQSANGAYDGVRPGVRPTPRFARPAGTGEYIAHGDGSDALPARIAKNVVRIKCITEAPDGGHVGVFGQGLMFDDSTIGFPVHLWKGEGVPRWVRIFQGNKAYVDKEVSPKNMCQFYLEQKPQDYCIVRVPPVGGFKQIWKHFPVSEPSRPEKVLIPAKNENGELCWFTGKVASIVDRKIDYSDTSITRGVTYSSFLGGKGESGSPVIGDFASGKICGVHVAGNKNTDTGLCLTITQKDLHGIREYFKKEFPSMRPVAAPAETSFVPQEGCHVPVTGTTAHAGLAPYTTNVMRETSLRPSIIHGEVAEVLREPAVLYGSDPRIATDARRIDPVHNCVEKFSDHGGCVPAQYLAQVTEDLGQKCAALARDAPRVLTNDEAVNGLPPGRALDRINLSSAPGAPYSIGWVPTNQLHTFVKVDGCQTGKRRFLSEDSPEHFQWGSHSPSE